ncbi:MAG: RNA-binding S4 domain-containing protein [Bacillota bacterium]
MGEGGRQVPILTPTIALDGFLKWCGAAPTGGQAKLLVRGGQVLVNDRVETRRSRLLAPGDLVEVKGRGRWRVGSPQGQCR